MDCSTGEWPERLLARPQYHMQARVMAAPITPQTLATTPTTSPLDAKYTSQQLSPPNISNQAMSEYPSTSRVRRMRLIFGIQKTWVSTSATQPTSSMDKSSSPGEA